MALAAYRQLIRAARIAFEGDTRVLTAARQQIRQGFQEKASLSPSDPSTEAAVKQAEELASFLKANVVQGRKEAGEERFKLRIHEHTERGDNDTIKYGDSTIRIDGKTCKDM